MASIKVFIQGERNPAGIYIRLTDGKTTDCKAKTKFIINPKDWSNLKGQPKSLKDADHMELNENLTLLKSDLLKHYNNRAATDLINTDWLKKFLAPDEKLSTSFVEYFEYYRTLRKAELTDNRYRLLKQPLDLLKRFEVHSKVKYRLLDFDQTFRAKFISYCKDQGYSDNSIALYFGVLRSVVSHAGGDQIPVSPQLNKLSVKYVDSPVIFLNESEQSVLASLDLPKTLIDTRDWILISCNTGQRYSDFSRFNHNMIRFEIMNIGGKEVNVPLLEFIQSKTKAKISLPLNKEMTRILAIRNGEFPEKVDYKYYEQKVKEICRIAGFTELTYGTISDPDEKKRQARPKTIKGYFEKYLLISSHIGRRSYATNNYGKIPTPLLMGVTGHTTEASFLRYIGKTDSTKALHLAQYMYS